LTHLVAYAKLKPEQGQNKNVLTLNREIKMRRKTRGSGRLKLVAAFLLVAVLLPKFLNSQAANNLGSFSDGETGIKLCAIINGGNEDALRFSVTSDEGFEADVIVSHNTCKNIHTEAANYLVHQYLPQEYELSSVSGVVPADSIEFVAVSGGQYSLVYTNTYTQKPYVHSFGYTSSNNSATAVEVRFDANGGTGTMAPQHYGLNSQDNLAANAFEREDYDFAGWNTKADGTGDSYSDSQSMTFSTGGELTLYAQWTESYRLAHVIRAKAAQNLGYQVDFSRVSVVSDDPDTANGNGVNKYTEDGKDIYYYRGQVSDNKVIWGGKCWTMVRTTSTGGIKMVYSGERDLEGGVPVNKCSVTGNDTLITYNNTQIFPFNSNDNSPADVGYMYGDRIEAQFLPINEEAAAIFSNDVIRDGDTYTLAGDMIAYDTSVAQETVVDIANGHHYFCINGAASCDDTKIAYMLMGTNDNDNNYDNDGIYYLPIGGYDNIEAAKTAMFANTHDSVAKATIEAWFEAENLNDDDLEDVVYCNDRSYGDGSLVGKDSNASLDGVTMAPSLHGAFVNIEHTLTPSLGCANKNDAFTKEDMTKGNGKLAHKVGMITIDELFMAGFVADYSASQQYLLDAAAHIMSPVGFYGPSTIAFSVMSTASIGFRPMVSLKSTLRFAEGGAGTADNPYIVVSE